MGTSAVPPKKVNVKWIDGAWTIFDPDDGDISVTERFRSAGISEVVEHVENGRTWHWLPRPRQFIAIDEPPPDKNKKLSKSDNNG